MNIKKLTPIICIFITLVTIALYLETKDHQFVYDSELYVSKNANIKKGVTKTSFVWAFTSFYASNWHPVTWISHTIDFSLFGLKPAGHHIVNVFFHIINAILVFLFIFKVTKAFWKSFLIALIFALHPLRVESVAWVAERKDLLSALFFLLSLLHYFFYVSYKKKLYYILSILFFILSLLSKPMVVTLPFILILLDYAVFKRSFDNKIIIEKIPFIIFSFVSCIITYIAQNKGGAVISANFYVTIANVFINYITYIYKTVVPINLSLIYPYNETPNFFLAIVCFFCFLFLTVTCFIQREKRPYLFWGWLWYVIMLLPVIGIVRIGHHSIADRYTYLPTIGVLVAVVFFISDISFIKKNKKTFFIVAAFIPAIFFVMSKSYLKNWKNQTTIMERIIKVTKASLIPYYNLGVVYENNKNYEKALYYYSKALAIVPYKKECIFNVSSVLFKQKRYKEALKPLNISLKNYPNSFITHKRYAISLFKTGDMEGALNYLKKALTINPDDAEIRNILNQIEEKRKKFINRLNEQ